MNCQSCRIEIEEMEMGESLSSAARSHLDGCLPCGAFYNERLSLRKLVGSLEPVSAPPDFDFRLRARLASSGRAGNHRLSWRSLIASAPAIGLAASFALLVAAVVIYNHFKTAPAANQPGVVADRKTEQRPETNIANSSTVTATSGSAVEASGAETKENPAPEILMTGGSSPRPHLAINNKNIARQPRQLETSGAQIVTNDIGSRSAPKITPAGNSPFTATSNPLVELPVRSSSQPMRVFVDDRSGGKRSVTLEPVIFGSQDLTGRNGSSVPTSQGIW